MRTPGEMVDERRCPRSTRPALALDGVADGTRQREAFQFGLHQNILRAFPQQSIGEVIVRLVRQNQNGSGTRAGR